MRLQGLGERRLLRYLHQALDNQVQLTSITSVFSYKLGLSAYEVQVTHQLPVYLLGVVFPLERGLGSLEGLGRESLHLRMNCSCCNCGGFFALGGVGGWGIFPQFIKVGFFVQLS